MTEDELCDRMWHQRFVNHPGHHTCTRPPGHKGYHKCHCDVRCVHDENTWAPGEPEAVVLHKLKGAPQPRKPRRTPAEANNVIPTPTEPPPEVAYDDPSVMRGPFTSGICRDPWERKCREQAKQGCAGLCRTHYAKAMKERRANRQKK